MDKNIAIKFSNVTKNYKLFKNDKSRLADLLLPNFIAPKNYVIKHANKDVSFEVKRGESVAILGRNGAGKSTMLKIATGVLEQTSGEVYVNGRVSALLELTAGFDNEFTGRENIYLRGRLMKMNTQDIEDIDDIIIEFAELGEYIDQPVRTYSSGMRARLGFAINANTHPDILIVDEALSVGDEKFREKCNELIDKLIDTDHIAVLLVTHSIQSAKSFCDRGIVMRDGSIIFDGPIEEAVSEYQGS